MALSRIFHEFPEKESTADIKKPEGAGRKTTRLPAFVIAKSAPDRAHRTERAGQSGCGQSTPDRPVLDRPAPVLSCGPNEYK